MTDTDPGRFTAIERRTLAVRCDGWQQRPGDAGVIEDTQGRPIAVLGTSGPTKLPLGEFVAHSRADMWWLIRELKNARSRIEDLEADNAQIRKILDADETTWRGMLNDLRGAINHAGSLMATSYVASIIEHTRVPGIGPRP
ncbi:hypothetical protein ACWC4A_52585 [Streptomyces mirabilis]